MYGICRSGSRRQSLPIPFSGLRERLGSLRLLVRGGIGRNLQVSVRNHGSGRMPVERIERRKIVRRGIR